MADPYFFSEVGYFFPTFPYFSLLSLYFGKTEKERKTCLMMQVVARIGHMRCTGWPMSWGLIVPPGLEPDGWCMPVCVVHAPLYVYHIYFSQK